MLFGAKQSSIFNLAITCVNIATLLLVIIAGSVKVETANWTVVNDSFVPYGAKSIFSAAGTLFFSYLGFDMVSTMAEEVKHPQRDLPIGIIGSLSISASIYISVALVVTGMVPFTTFIDSDAPLSLAFRHVGLTWVSQIVAFGSLAGLTTATFTSILGQSRIFYRMSKDGLIFSFFSNIHQKTKVPIIGIIVIGAITSLIAFFTSLDILADAISIGTLAAFATVNSGVIIFRYKSRYPRLILILVLSFAVLVLLASFLIVYEQIIAGSIFGGIGFLELVVMCFLKQSDIPEHFKTPLVPIIPALGVSVNLYMMASLNPESWIRVIVWLAFGLCIYFGYGIRHSTLRQPVEDKNSHPEKINEKGHED